MKFTLRYLLSLTAVAALPLMAQDLHTAYFDDTFLYQHELNPASGNDQNYVAVPIVGNLNIKMMGNFGYNDVVRKNPLYPNESDKKMTTFLNPYLTDPLDGFSTGDNRLAGQAKLTILSAGFKAWGGYNTVGVNLRANVNGKFPYELLQFATEMGNEHYEIGSIRTDAIGFCELAFGHSRNVNEKLRFGAKLKVLLGLGNASIKMDDVVADLNDADKWTLQAKAESHFSVKGFEYESGTKEYDARPGEYSYVRDMNVHNGGLDGLGLAADLGFTYKINDQFSLSGALLDLGFISWNNDYYAKNTIGTFVFDGFHDVSMKKYDDDNLEVQTDRYVDQVADFAHLTDQGDQGGRTTGIGATLNLGGSYTLPSYKALSFGLLATQRINGKYSWTEGRLSANLAPAAWINAAASLSVNSFAASAGWLVNLHAKKLNFFFGMDQILSKCSKELIPLNSNASVSMGLNVVW